MLTCRELTLRTTDDLDLCLYRKKNREDYKVDHSAVAKVVFSSPAFASVGLTEEEAIEQEKNVDVFTSTFT